MFITCKYFLDTLDTSFFLLINTSQLSLKKICHFPHLETNTHKFHNELENQVKTLDAQSCLFLACQLF